MDKKKQPANFIDLRKPAKKRPARLIQDILSPQKTKRWWVLGERIVEVIVLLAVIIFLWNLLQTKNPLPSNLSKQIKFTTFVPTKLPSGYRLATKTYAINNNVLTFDVYSPKNQDILISEQILPSNFDVDHFQQSEIKNRQIQNVKYGTAYFGNLEASQIGSLVNSGTWIFVSEPRQVGNDNDLIAVMQALHKF